MTRKFFIVLLLLSLSIPGIAQIRQRRQRTIHTENMPKYDRRRFHFGINLGMIMTTLAIRPISDLRSIPDTIYAVNSTWQPGFSMGIESNLRLSEHWDFRFTPTLSLASHILEFDRPGHKDRFEIPSTYIEFPLYFKFKSARLTNFRAYVIGGAKYVFDLSNKVKAEDAAEYPVKLNPHDIQAELGFGMDFYLPYFKFSTQLKVAWGFMNMKYTENNIYNSAIEQINARSIFISFLFE